MEINGQYNLNNEVDKNGLYVNCKKTNSGLVLLQRL